METKTRKGLVGKLLGTALAGCFAASLTVVSSGCGGGQKTESELRDCYNRCDLGMMACMDEWNCVDMDGHSIPCKEDCETQAANCEVSCSE